MDWQTAFTNAAAQHSNLIASGKIPQWIAYADLHPVITAGGDSKRLTWWNWFMKLNTVRLYNLLPVTFDPPGD